MTKKTVLGIVIVLAILHQDFWAWDDIGLPWTPTVEYTGDGQTTAYRFDFPIKTAGSLRVVISDPKISEHEVDYHADGSTRTYAFPFRIYEPSEIAVYAYEAKAGEYTKKALTHETDYTLEFDPPDPGGQVTLTTAPPEGTVVVLHSLNKIRKTLGKHFTVSGGPWDSGGEVTFTRAPAEGTTISMTNDRPLWGFMPVGLAYHALYSLVAALVWGLAIKFAWPSEIEEFAEGKTETLNV